MEPGAARAARGTAERSTQGTDHCHQMLLLSLLPRILRRGGVGGRGRKEAIYPFQAAFSFLFLLFFSPLLFSELPRVTCLCAAVHVRLRDEAAGKKAEVK